MSDDDLRLNTLHRFANLTLALKSRDRASAALVQTLLLLLGGCGAMGSSTGEPGASAGEPSFSSSSRAPAASASGAAAPAASAIADPESLSTQPPSGAVHIAAGGGGACAWLEDGSVYCWGENDFGQLGNGEMNPDLPGMGASGGGGGRLNETIPRLVRTVRGPTSVALGDAHACAVADGKVLCWGNNGYGQTGSTSDEAQFVVNGLPNGVLAVFAGARSSCALVPGNEARCWGNNQYGQLGNGAAADPCCSVHVPLVVTEASDIAELALGEWHGCARSKTGEVRCWGKEFGAKGVVIPGVVATQIAAGDATTCARSKAGRVSCWLSADYIESIDVSAAVQIDVGEAHACARLTDDTVVCWGANGYGQLGRKEQGAHFHAKLAPKPVADLSDVHEIAVEGNHTCALRGDGVVLCWGQNSSGELGDGTTTSRSEPRHVRWSR